MQRERSEFLFTISPSHGFKLGGGGSDYTTQESERGGGREEAEDAPAAGVVQVPSKADFLTTSSPIHVGLSISGQQSSGSSSSSGTAYGNLVRGGSSQVAEGRVPTQTQTENEGGT